MEILLPIYEMPNEFKKKGILTKKSIKFTSEALGLCFDEKNKYEIYQLVTTLLTFTSSISTFLSLIKPWFILLHLSIQRL